MRLEDLYGFFKPDPQCVVWANDTEVCIGWEHTKGHCRWYEEAGVVKFAFVQVDETKPEPEAKVQKPPRDSGMPETACSKKF